MPVKIGIVDSGIDGETFAVAAATGFAPDGAGGVREVPATPDRVGHGSAVAAIIQSLAPAVRFVDAQVFPVRRGADPALAAAGIRWCLRQGVRIVNLSFGALDDRHELRTACAEAARQGVLVIAAHPARGPAVFPAAYPEVLAVSGDARCEGAAWSVLERGRLYGTSPRAADGRTPGGASFAAARLAGIAARCFAASSELSPAAVRAWLDGHAAHSGRERRSPAPALA
ncbi:MAG: S8 family serine peptidase [Rhodocyclaceae bacterium]|nr:S8 family serine peptidase [Rhodocyclaceae bacterium]